MGINNFGLVCKKTDYKNMMYRGAQPTSRALKFDLPNIGVDCIFKLNKDNEYSNDVERSLFSPGLVIIEEYQSIFRYADYDRVVKTASNLDTMLQSHTIYIHCSHGIDRTSLIVNAWQIIYDLKTYADILEERKWFCNDEMIHKLADFPDLVILQKIYENIGKAKIEAFKKNN